MGSEQGKNLWPRYYLPQISCPFTLLLMHRLFLITWLGLSTSLVTAKPNVVILFTDDQGTLDANCYGSKDLFTPNIDRLAKTGVRFTQAYAHTVCCPSRAALMTGRHPQRGGVNHWTQGNMNGPNGINMALEEVTLAEALKDRESTRLNSSHALTPYAVFCLKKKKNKKKQTKNKKTECEHV